MNNKCTEINNTERELKGWVKEEGGLRFYLGDRRLVSG